MRAFLAVAPVFLVLTACIGDDFSSTERIGLVSVRAFSNSGTPVVRGSAVFYSARGLVIRPTGLQDCGLFTYDPAPTNNFGQTLNAGANVNFTIGAFSEVALPAEGATYPVYNFAAGSYLDFSTGDSALVTIPGAVGGFEAMSVKARLAEPFTAAPPPAYVTNTPMNLTWQAATFPGSIMVVSLRYNAAPGASAPNVEIACAFEDDGSAQIPIPFADAYGSSSPTTRDYAFIRVRERVVEFDGRTRTQVRSIYEYPAKSLIDAP